jgi:hypothetical protein
MCTLNFLSDIMDAKVKNLAKKSSHIAAQFDSWSYGIHKITAVTMTLPGFSVFVGAFENWSADTAINSAAAVHSCLLDALGLPPNTPPDNEIIPIGKISGVTSDTTAVMPATVKELRLTRLGQGAEWTPCAVHVINLYLLDQVKHIPCIKQLLVHATQLAMLFRLAGVHKIFVMCACLPTPCAC